MNQNYEWDIGKLGFFRILKKKLGKGGWVGHVGVI
jgi:hypothetical protein